MISEIKIPVRYAETDKMGVVYHANYLIWFEVGRTDFLEKINQPYISFEEKGIMSPVLRAECDYGSPLRYGDTAIVQTKVIEVTGTKTVFSYKIFKENEKGEQGDLCCSGKTLHCLIKSDDFKPLSMKKTTPDLYESYLKVLEPDV